MEKRDNDTLNRIYINDERFFTAKDHKECFMNNPTICLINPTKSELGRISKEILYKINNN